VSIGIYGGPWQASLVWGNCGDNLLLRKQLPQNRVTPTLLTDVAIRKEKPGPAPRKLFDCGGLYLLLNPDGSRWWRFKYRIFGRERLLSLGVYPAITLKRARDRRDEARRLIADGIDPALKRQAEKQAAGENFESVAREWLSCKKITSRPARWAVSAIGLSISFSPIWASEPSLK